MRRPHGVGIIYDTHQTVEMDTYKCAHCQAIKHVKPKERPEDIGGLCYVCSGLICSACVGKGCDPFEEKLKRMEARDEARRSYG